MASSFQLQYPGPLHRLSTSSITLTQCKMLEISGMADSGVEESIKRGICDALRGGAAGNVARMWFLYSERRLLKNAACTASARVCAADIGGAESMEARKCCRKDSCEVKSDSRECIKAL